MSLSAGTRLGPYDVMSPLGAGGMGEVYRARDTTLNRDVALKILPAAFASDADRLARFTREAQTLAALNHPHIAQVYGFEDAGGVRALVMELVGGDDLSVLLARGAMPLAEALPIARQIADALEATLRRSRARDHRAVRRRRASPMSRSRYRDVAIKVLPESFALDADPAPTSAPTKSSRHLPR